MFNLPKVIGQQERFQTSNLKTSKLEENTVELGTTILHTQLFNGILKLIFLNLMGRHHLAIFMQIPMDLTFVILHLKMSISTVIASNL